MPDVMVRPNWPGGKFFRTVTVTSKKGEAVKRRIAFTRDAPTTLTDKEFEQIKPDLGKSLFEVAYDDKLRPRLLEPEAPAEAAEPSQAEG